MHADPNHAGRIPGAVRKLTGGVVRAGDGSFWLGNAMAMLK